MEYLKVVMDNVIQNVKFVSEFNSSVARDVVMSHVHILTLIALVHFIMMTMIITLIMSRIMSRIKALSSCFLISSS
ncbi:unnamed protein product [Trichobilharzia szidati]|nr:unnamed protein product [Trichobilharzia szidati]